MAYEIKIPAVGESITSAMVGEWHKKDGEAVSKDEELLTIETDKVSTEIIAEADGILKILVPEGEEVEIGAVVGRIEEGEGGGEESAEKAPAAEAEEKKPEKEPEPAEAKAEKPEPGEGKEEKAKPEPKPEKAEAKAKEKEEEESRKPDLSVVATAPAEPEESAASPVDESGRTTRKKLSPLRRKIATQLVNAQQEAAILTTFNECDMSAVMALRKQIQESFMEKHGVKLGFMSFFVKAVVDALQNVPQLNSRLEGNEQVQNHFYDIGVAVGTEKGLIVPVLRDCDKKGFGQIEKDILDYAQRARDGKIQLNDISGGCFTISNGGVYGSLLSTPILNPPQSGILGMHTIQQRPVAVDGKVEIRPMMYLALSYDHRIVDGKEAVTFLVRVKECIEQPTRLLLQA